MNTKHVVKSHYEQQGSVLIISLAILVMVGVMAVGALNIMPFKERFISQQYDYDAAYRSAQSGLVQALNRLKDANYPLESFITDMPCDELCFTPDCSEGLCASIDYPNGGQCVHHEPMPALWADDAVWANDTKHQVVQPLADVAEPAKYIVEFMCYAATEPKFPPPAGGGYGPGWSLMFRVTVKGVGHTTGSYVKLQSTVKVPIN